MLSQDGSESGLGADLRGLLCSRPKVAAAGRVEAQRRARATMMTAGLGLWAAITIAVAGPATSPEYLPVHLAQAEGYFAQEKLEVTLKVERSEGEAARMLGRGQADLAATSIDTAYGQVHVAGAPPLLLFGLTAAPPVAIVVAPSHRTSIRSLADLRGQPVGLPGAGTPCSPPSFPMPGSGSSRSRCTAMVFSALPAPSSRDRSPRPSWAIRG